MERFVVPSELLRANREEAILIVRLGALANAAAAVASMQASSIATTIGYGRDLLQSVLLLVSYLRKRATQLTTASVGA